MWATPSRYPACVSLSLSLFLSLSTSIAAARVTTVLVIAAATAATNSFARPKGRALPGWRPLRAGGGRRGSRSRGTGARPPSSCWSATSCSPLIVATLRVRERSNPQAWGLVLFRMHTSGVRPAYFVGDQSVGVRLLCAGVRGGIRRGKVIAG